MKAPITISRPKLLIGEGNDELRVFEALMTHFRLETEIQVLEFGGKTRLGSFLQALRAVDGFNQLQSLGITRDADDSSENAQQSILTLIDNAAFSDALRVRYYVLPGPARTGALEDMCCDALSGSAVWRCVEEMIACRDRVLGDRPATVSGKAKVQAWLSTLDRPGLRLGEAAAAGLIPFDDPAFNSLVEFVRSL